jgi:hypothetical protein
MYFLVLEYRTMDQVKKPSDSECKIHLLFRNCLRATSRRVENINITCPLIDPFVLKPGFDMQREETISSVT